MHSSRSSKSDCEYALTYTQMFRASACGHELCRSCMKDLIAHKIKDKQYPILCPRPACGSALSLSDCSAILDSEQALNKLMEVWLLLTDANSKV